MALDKRKRGKPYRTYQPCYALLNHFQSVIGAHTGETATCLYGFEEAWGKEALDRFLTADTLLGMSEAELCNKVKLRLKAIGWSVVECELSYASRKGSDT